MYSEGSFEGVRIRRVRVGGVGWARASFMKTRPLAPGVLFVSGVDGWCFAGLLIFEEHRSLSEALMYLDAVDNSL